MTAALQERILNLQQRMTEENIDFLLLTDPDTIYYFSGFWGDLGMDFGRPMIVAVPRSGSCTLVTPAMEAAMVRAMTWIGDIREWIDGVEEEWRKHLRHLFSGLKKLSIGIERFKTPPLVTEWLRSEVTGANLIDVAETLAEMRIVKSPEEIEIMRQAGQVAVAMAEAAAKVITEGVPEYEVALAVYAGGTRKAAEFLQSEGRDRFYSPTIHNLQVLQSGSDTCMVHRRSSARRIQGGEPVYLCFCAIARFRNFKLGFDREWFVGSVKDEDARVYEVAVEAQETALKMIRPGVIAEDVHKAANEVYRSAGLEAGYRTGRGIGYSFLENPQLKDGDRTPLEAGMTLAVDGGITIPGKFGARVGDSIVVTETGYEYLTPYPKDLASLIV